MSEQEFDPSEDGVVDLEAELPRAEAGAEDVAAKEAEIPRDPLTVAKEELAQWRDRALRTQADLENFRKRAARERADAIKFGNASLLEDLLPIVDNFEMGLVAAAAAADGVESSIAQGMQMVQKQLVDFLANHGLKEVETDGKLFDPNLHEALSQKSSDEVPEGHVILTLRKGYHLQDRLLRAANVIVSTGSAVTES